MNDIVELAAEVVKPFEGCHRKVRTSDGYLLKPYLCPANVLTIGWGETGPHITPETRWTQEQADMTLELRLKQYLLGVYKRCPALYLLPPEMAAACTSLAYNIGLGAFGASSVCRHIKRGDLAKAADSILLWNKGGGRVLAGLTRRRHAERLLFLKGLDR
ncbi:MAG TPA: lysozyme [Noviherbaspirillum sp.]|jgi:lysozyme|uniref:lysozyme n=1 Tax=Noviherbaspirillum sp. TaxID=1926288 RepID=UPI002DDCDD7E|nr:lysozyme [Noviherbaspirillum sp.]HEV2612551.1 lysozyme [Noviherbaspirillum sp.]